jgi:hypothetical protein
VDSATDWGKLSKFPIDGIVTNKPIAYNKWVQTSCATTSHRQ